ncbi:hypothetical protein ISCGN_026690 [Ixodes scapularis]
MVSTTGRTTRGAGLRFYAEIAASVEFFLVHFSWEYLLATSRKTLYWDTLVIVLPVPLYRMETVPLCAAGLFKRVRRFPVPASTKDFFVRLHLEVLPVKVTYPRSGSHWVQQIIQLILNSGESVKTYTEFIERAPFLEFQPSIEAGRAPRLLRTHSQMGRLPISPKAKFVYVARNPWDCCVSCFNVTREANECGFQDGTFEEFLDLFLDAQFGFGDYFDHLLSGYERRNEPNVFFVTYEDLHKNKAAVVKRLARFLGPNYGMMMENNYGYCQKVLEKSTAEYMNGLMRVQQSEILELSKGNLDPTNPENNDGEQCVVNIIRNGKVGEWKEYFTLENIKKMKAKIDKKTKGSGVMSLWKSEEPSLD